ncbi:hypothetical protein RB195_001908 [Necator americanus]
MQSDIVKKLIDVAPIVIPIIIAYFEVVGLFGNINLIAATARHKHLRTKHGILLALTTFYQTFCLLGELANVAAAVLGGSLKKQDVCFLLMIPYIWFCCMQSTMFLILSLDMLFSVTLPLKHMVIREWIYASVASIPPILYASLIITMNSLEVLIGNKHNNTVVVCNPSLSMDSGVANFWVNWNAFSNLGVLIVYFSVYLLVMNKEKQQQKLGRVMTNAGEKQADKQQRQSFPLRKSLSLNSLNAQVKKAVEGKRTLISLMWLMAIFTLTWCTCMFSQGIVSWMPPSDIKIFVEAYSIIFAMMSYSVNYYVYFARNPTYRKAFLQQLACLLPKRIWNTNFLSNTTRTPRNVKAIAHSLSMPSTYHRQNKPGMTRQNDTNSSCRFEIGGV